MKSWQAAD